MTPAYYAEDEIDRLVRESFYADFSYRGVIVEVGAASPDALSVSQHFRDNGWRVIAIEPNPAFCAAHRKRGYSVLQYAVGNEDRDGVDFNVVRSDGTYKGCDLTFESFSSLAIKDSYRALRPDLTSEVIQVKLRKLDTILRTDAAEVKKIDILSIDVEGWELEVLDGFTIRDWNPRVVILENLFGDPIYAQRMDAFGYDLWHAVHPNQIFLRRQRRHSLKRLVGQILRSLSFRSAPAK